MNKLILFFVFGCFITSTLCAETIGAITGSRTVCVGDSTMLSDTTLHGLWSSSNTSVATIDTGTGYFTGVAAGTAVITYATDSGYVTVSVTVDANPSAITGTAAICIGGTTTTALSDPTAGGTWSSENPFIVSVGSASGVLTGVSAGSIAISYTLPTGCYATTTVTANSLAILGVGVLCVGGTTVTLSDATPGGAWSSGSTGIATIGTSGIVSPVALGVASITYTLSAGCVATTSITVKGLPNITPSSIEGCVNSTYQLTASPAGGTWASGDASIASVNFLGVVTGVAPGVTAITYTAAGGCSVSIPVTINPLPAAIAGTDYVYSGLTTTLSDGTPGGTWSSGSPALATINASTGVVTGMASGVLFVSYTLPDGCFSYFEIEVNPLPGTTNLYAWYPFCADTLDHSGNGRTLINSGPATTPATLTADRFGNANSAFHFNGVNSMMNYTTFFPNSGTPPDFTYSCWINSAGPQSAVILYNGDINANGFGFVINNGVMGTVGDSVGIYFGASTGLYAQQYVSPGSWHNLVLVKNGGVYNFYVDDAPGLFFLETTTPTFTGVFNLGINYQSTLAGPLTEAFNGDIDDVAVISRQLSSAERLSLFNFDPDVSHFTLGNDTTICTDAITLAPVPLTTGAIYTWSTYTPTSITILDTTSPAITVYPPVGGLGTNYVLKVSLPYGCSAGDTITVFKAPIPVSLGPNQNVCIGDTITLSASYPGATFLWNTGDTTSSIKVTASGTYYVTVDSVHTYGPGDIDTSVCVGRDTVTIDFYAVPFVSLPATPVSCDGANVKLYSYNDPSYTYLWNTLQTTDTILVSTSGTYYVQVSDHGCTRNDTANVTIVFDTVDFYLSPDTAICAGSQPFHRSASPPATPLTTYLWTPTAGIRSGYNSFFAQFTPDTSTEYTLTVSYPGCPNLVDSFFVAVQPNPVVSVGGDRNVCYGDTLHLDAVVKPAWYTGYIFSWVPGTGLSGTTLSDIVFDSYGAPNDTATLKFVLTVTTPAWRPGLVPANLCINKDSGIIYVHPRFFDTVTSFVNLCPGDSAQLITGDTSTVGAVAKAWRWSPSMYLGDSTSSDPWVYPVTSQDYTVVVYSQYGCRDTLSVDVNVYPAALLEMPDSVSIYPGNSYLIAPQTNCVNFLWSPVWGLSGTSLSDPTATPQVNTTYYVHASTYDGCTVTDSILIKLDPTNLIGIPNAFTPGKSTNSTFYVLTQGDVSLNYFRIYDRWGVMVFSTTNINDAWDGTYKGAPQPFGVYVYELQATTVTGQVFTRTGNVTLIR